MSLLEDDERPNGAYLGEGLHNIAMSNRLPAISPFLTMLTTAVALIGQHAFSSL